MDEIRKTGRVTIPTDLDVVPETLEILKKWGADAIRDCDGTDFPQQLKDADAKIYSTYYTTRKDNAWAKANPDEVQQCYIMTGFYTAPGDTVTIPLMKGISPELMQVNTNDDIARWWEVMDRTTGQPVPPEQWSYANGSDRLGTAFLNSHFKGLQVDFTDSLLVCIGDQTSQCITVGFLIVECKVLHKGD